MYRVLPPSKSPPRRAPRAFLPLPGCSSRWAQKNRNFHPGPTRRLIGRTPAKTKAQPPRPNVAPTKDNRNQREAPNRDWPPHKRNLPKRFPDRTRSCLRSSVGTISRLSQTVTDPCKVFSCSCHWPSCALRLQAGTETSNSEPSATTSTLDVRTNNIFKGQVSLSARRKRLKDWLTATCGLVVKDTVPILFKTCARASNPKVLKRQ